MQQPGSLRRDGFTFTGWGRCRDRCRRPLLLLDPRARGPTTPGAAPFVAITVFARGLLNRLFTRAYLPGDLDALAADPLLAGLDPERREHARWPPRTRPVCASTSASRARARPSSSGIRDTEPHGGSLLAGQRPSRRRLHERCAGRGDGRRRGGVARRPRRCRHRPGHRRRAGPPLAGRLPTMLEWLAHESEAGGNPAMALVALLRDGLRDAAPDAATWLHRGLTSQDVVDSALMICARDAVVRLREALRDQVGLLSRLVEEHRSTPMVARTLTQHAVPTTFGLKAAGWLTGVLDAYDDVAALVLPVQVGGAAGTMAGVVELADHLPDPVGVAHQLSVELADRLGLTPSTPWHTSRASVTRVGDASVRCTDAWGRIAGDVLVLSRPEIGEVSEGTGGGSSTMPHKSNPVLATLVRRAALTTPQLAATLHQAAAESTDERSPGPWHAEWATLRTLLRRAVVAGDQATDLLQGLRVHADRMGRTLAAAHDDVRAEQRSMAAPDRAPAARGLPRCDRRAHRGPPGAGDRRPGRPRSDSTTRGDSVIPSITAVRLTGARAPGRAPAPRARPLARHVRDDAVVAVRGRAHRRLRPARLGPPGPRPQPGRARRAVHHGRAGRGRAAGGRRRARRARRDRRPVLLRGRLRRRRRGPAAAGRPPRPGRGRRPALHRGQDRRRGHVDRAGWPRSARPAPR